MDYVIEPTLQNVIADLKSTLQGEAFLPGEEGFAEAISGWNLLIQHQPAVVVLAKSEADVQAAILFANRMDLPIAVQATGHGQFKTCEGGLLLNVSALNQVEIDAANQSAKVGGGTQWCEVIEKAGVFNLMPISGSSPMVGVVGYTLGGGYGILSRKYGLGVDQAISIRLVTPDGEVKTLSEVENQDLFWAILGGGGSFGVVTQIEIKLHPQPNILGGSVMFDASLADVVYPAFLAFTKEAPEEVTSALSMMTFPPVPFIPEFLHGRSMLIFCATALGELSDAEAMLAPIRGLPGAEFDSFRPMTYADTHTVFNDPTEALPATCRGVLVKDLDEALLQETLAAVGPAPTSENLIFRIRHYGGAISRMDESRDSIGHKRQANYLVYLLGVPMGPVTLEQMAAQADRVFAALEPQLLAHGPLNWLGEANVSGAAVQKLFTSENCARQLAVKQSVDPANRFRFAGVGLA